MTWLRKARPLLFVLGGLVLTGSLLGARLLAPGAGGGTDATPKSAAPPTNGAGGSGPVVIGTVDSEKPLVRPGLPPVLQSGEVVKVFVASGAEVKAGDPLYQFNTTILEGKRTEAERAADVARANIRKATAMQDQHKTSIDTQKQKLKAAELKVDRTQKGYHLYRDNYRKSLPRDTPQERVDELMANEPELFKLETAYLTAVQERDAEKLALTALETADVGAAVDIATAEVKRYEALVAEAKTAVEMCTVRAHVAGTVERVNVSAGDVLGISTRTPAMVLVPAGPRVVRAEVEAEFAHRVGPDKIGKEVTIYDHTDPKLTYKGVVKRIGDAFLPKRNSGDGLIQNDTLVLEVVIEVTDAAPPGKPPLRVGQKVRVNFGQ